MRTSNYKIGWIIKPTLVGLTHFHPEIIEEDFLGIYKQTEILFKTVTDEFHLIIDNRLAPMKSLHSLIELQESFHFLRNEFLGYIIIVKPNHLKIESKNNSIEVANGVRLKNVSSIQEGINFLQKNKAISKSETLDKLFFPDVEIIM